MRPFSQTSQWIAARSHWPTERLLTAAAQRGLTLSSARISKIRRAVEEGRLAAPALGGRRAAPPPPQPPAQPTTEASSPPPPRPEEPAAPMSSETEREFHRLAVRIGIERARGILSIIEAEHSLLGPWIDA